MWVYGGTLIPDDAEPLGLRQLAAADPQFDLAAFVDLARTVHTNVHAAVAARDLAPVRGVLADDLADALAGRDDRAWSAAVDEHVHTAALDAVHGERDRVTVRFGASIGGRATVEDWTFERDGTDYPHLRGQAPTACLACGAPLATDERGDCRYCGTHLLGVAGRWQVTAVDPPRVLPPVSPDLSLAGLDPTFQPEAFLAFAGDAFVRIRAATAAGRLDDVGDVVTSELRARLAAVGRDGGGGGDDDDGLAWDLPVQEVTHVVLVDAQHGAVDRLTVRIVGRAADGEVGDVVEDWTFERPAPARGEVPPPPTACPCCGAPIDLDQEGRCRYCTTHLLGVAGQWRLAAASPPRTEMVTHPVVVAAMQRPGCQLALAVGVLAVLLGSVASVVWLIIAR